MSVFRPFRAIRASKELVDKVASLPYDVMNREEAKDMAKGNEYSFLHVVRSEIDLDDTVSQYDERVYSRAKENLTKFQQDGILIQDETKKYYIYKQIMKGRSQTGLVGCVSIDEYSNNIIKKHEYTRPEKEEDRINHFDVCNANTEPVFLAYKSNREINRIVKDWIESNKPIYEFTSDDGVIHIAWDIKNEALIDRIQEIFSNIECLYIADGHHRSASAVKVGQKRREYIKNYSGDEEFNFFMTVAFPDEDLYIMDYNRVVIDLNNNTKDEFLSKVSEKFDVSEYNGHGQYSPTKKHEFGMYIDNKWYIINCKLGTYNEEDEVARLDASILQNNLLAPILGINDPRTDKRIVFVGGIRGLEELEKKVNECMKVAFSMYPTSMDDLISVADSGKIMPPKSTWFEPKLVSGLFIHDLEG